MSRYMYMCHIWKILPDESMKSLTLARSSSMQKRTLLFWSHPWEHHTAAKPTFHSSGSSYAIFFPGFVVILYFSFLLIYGNFGGLGLGLGFWGWDFQLMGFGAFGVGSSGFFRARARYINIEE